jgi:hypothetical protein
LKVSFEDGIARTVDWYKFFFSVIYPGGNVGSQVAPAPDPFMSVCNAPALIGSTDTDLETDSNTRRAPHQLRTRVSRFFTTTETGDEDEPLDLERRNSV